jgi:hypothetical protein
MVTRDIQAAERLADLEDVVNEWGGSFDYIHISAALVKYSKLPHNQQAAGNKLLHVLLSKWRRQLELADPQACANVLWACGQLGSRNVDSATWDSTWQAFMQHWQQAYLAGATAGMKPQELSNTLWACAVLRKQPAAEELQLLLQCLLQPQVLSQATTQAIANTIWALGRLQQLPS